MSRGRLGALALDAFAGFATADKESGFIDLDLPQLFLALGLAAGLVTLCELNGISRSNLYSKVCPPIHLCGLSLRESR